MIYLLLLLLLPHALWMHYVIIAASDRVRADGKMTLPMKVFVAPVLGAGLFLDVACNITVASVLFLQLPHEPFVTQRLKKLAKGTGWRQRVAVWIGGNLLNAYDRTGSHID